MLVIRPIEKQDDGAISEIINQVGREFGAIGDGFGPSDAEVLAMSEHYLSEQGARYFVAELNNQVIGGGGIAALNNEGVCELRKLFMLPEARGKGVGGKLVTACLDYAQQQGYKACYLDTLKTMTGAIHLYQQFGFEPLNEPYPGTIHCGCDVWMLKSLQPCHAL